MRLRTAAVMLWCWYDAKFGRVAVGGVRQSPGWIPKYLG